MANGQTAQDRLLALPIEWRTAVLLTMGYPPVPADDTTANDHINDMVLRASEEERSEQLAETLTAFEAQRAAVLSEIARAAGH